MASNAPLPPCVTTKPNVLAQIATALRMVDRAIPYRDGTIADALEAAREEIPALRTRLAKAMEVVADFANETVIGLDPAVLDRTDALLEREGYTHCLGDDGNCGKWLAPGTACSNCPEGTDG